MTPRQRIEAVLAGRKPDRPPFSFWHHFAADEAAGPKAVAAHLRLLETYQPDFLKVMNDNGYPHMGRIREIDDLSSLVELRGDEPEFQRQLELIASLRQSVGRDLFLITTIFNAWAVLRQLIEPPREHHSPDYNALADAPSRWIRSAWDRDPRAVEGALQTVGRNLAKFASRCIDAGADGIFLSVRDDWVDARGHDALYQKLVRPIDLEILAGASQGRFNMLHVCGKSIDFKIFAAYPVHAINWADRIAGPSIAEVKAWLGPAICAGINHEQTLPNGTSEDVAHEVADALHQAGDRPIMICPGCTFDPARVPKANLQRLARAVRET